MANSNISSLLEELGSENGLKRQRSRKALVAIGVPAVPALIQKESDPNPQVRWEVTKALCEIASAEASQALVQELEDDEFSIRWLATEALIRLGPAGLSPLLRALMCSSDSIRLRKGAHHILRALARNHELPKPVEPVLHALEDVEPAMGVPWAAASAWYELMRAHSSYTES